MTFPDILQMQLALAVEVYFTTLADRHSGQDNRKCRYGKAETPILSTDWDAGIFSATLPAAGSSERGRQPGNSTAGSASLTARRHLS